AIVAGGSGEGADDGIRAEELPRLAHMPLSVIEMDTVETEPGRQPEMVGEHEVHVARMAEGAHRVGRATKFRLGSRTCPDPDAGNVETIEKDLEIAQRFISRERRDDKVETGNWHVCFHRSGLRAGAGPCLTEGGWIHGAGRGSAAQDAPSGIERAFAKVILDAQELVVLGKAVGARQ